jgi:hypothetical protein
VTVDGSDPPFMFTTVEDGAADDVRSSLRLTLPGVGNGWHRRWFRSSSTRGRHSAGTDRHITAQFILETLTAEDPADAERSDQLPNID